MAPIMKPLVIAGVLCALAWNTVPGRAEAPSTAPRSAADNDLDHLRTAVMEAAQKGDVDGMLRYVHPEAVVIFPDGRILQGRQAVRDYMDKMTKAPDHIVASVTNAPEILSRTVHDDVALSYGLAHDHYVLTDGKAFNLDSRFTVTLLKSAEGPVESGGWMIRSFHSSTDAFDNDVLALAIKKTMWMAGLVGLAIGAVVGLIVGVLLKSRRKTTNA